MSCDAKLVRNLIGVLLIISNIGQVTSCDTDNNWISVGNRCYRYFQQALTWDAARANCRQFNGDLIVISSATVVSTLQNTFDNISNNFWIGLRDQVGANNLADYRWTDGTSLTGYTNWASGQPSNTNQRCVVADSQWLWYDESCTQTSSYMCQKNPAVVNVVNRATITQQENVRIGNIAVQLSENVAVNNVSVTCRVSNAALDITNLAFSTIVISPGGNSANVPYSITSGGQAAVISCSAQSVTGTQFQTGSSAGLTGSIRVVKAPRADFCADVVVVPVTGSGSVIVELSENAVGNPVAIVCNTVSTATAQIAIVQQNIAVGARTVSMSYTVSNQDLGDASVICTAQSLNGGTQFLTATSASRNTTFRLQVATLNLIPRYNNMFRDSITLYLIVNIPIPRAEFAAIFTCCLNYQSEVANQNFANCNSQITSTIVQANGTFATLALSRATITFQSGEYFKAINVTASPSIDQNWKDIFVVTCLSGSGNTNPRYTGLNTTALINLDLSASVRENVTQGSSLTNINPAFTDIAPCPCDLTVNFCDANCCCDSDCTAIDRAAFTTCLQPFVVRPLEHDCRAVWPDKQDYEALMCVFIDNNPLLGYFFAIRSEVTTVASFNALVTASRAIYSYNEAETQTFSSKITDIVAYRYGSPIVLDISNGLTGYLTLPNQIVGGCSNRGLVRYLVNSNSQCTQVISNSLCTPTSYWSATQYLMSRSISFPPCPIPNAIRKRFTGAAVALSTVNYYCPNISPYITNGQPTTNTNTASLTRCNFDDGRTRPPSPQLDPTSTQCNNVVVKVDYTIYWIGQEIDRVVADIIMGNVPLTSTATGRRQSTLTQQFNVQYVHNITVSPVITYSGNPGYLNKYPILFAVNSNSTITPPVITSTGAYLRRWSPRSNDLCTNADRVSVIFGNDEISGCTLSLTIADFQNCTALRGRVKSLLDALISADYVGKRGNSSDTIDTDWLTIIKEEPTYNDTVDTNTDTVNSAKCSEIPSTLNVTFLTANVRTPPIGELQMEIVGARISYNLEEWEYICGTGGAYGCSSQVNDTADSLQLDLTQPSSNTSSSTTTITFSSQAKPFIVKVLTTFIEVPAIQQTNEPLSAEQARARSKKCCSDILYPFSLMEFGRIARDRALGFMIMIILFLIGGIAVTKPWI